MANVLNSTTQSILRGLPEPILGPVGNLILTPEGGFGGASGPTDGLLSYWNMEGIDLVDQHGSNTLVDYNTVGSRTGPGGLLTAVDTEDTRDEMLYAPAGIGFENHSILSFTGWVLFDVSNIPHYFLFCGSDYNTASAFQYQFRRNASSITTEIRLGSTDVGRETLVGPTIANGVWAFFFMYINTETNEMGLSINDGTVSTQALTGTRVVAPSTLKMGLAWPSYGMDGGMASYTAWSKQLDADTVTLLYNGGVRPLYADLF